MAGRTPLESQCTPKSTPFESCYNKGRLLHTRLSSNIFPVPERLISTALVRESQEKACL
jgi:hypothetical protein